MVRPLRNQFVGVVYHVTPRGNTLPPIVRDDRDRRVWLLLTGDVVNRYHCLRFASCVLTNNYHLLMGKSRVHHIVLPVLDYRCTQKAVEDHLGLHYSCLSQIVTRRHLENSRSKT